MARKKQNRKRMLSDDDKEKLFKKHIGLLVVIAEKYAYLCRLLEIQDLVQEGWFALVDAAEYFDESKKTKFSSYAGKAIKGKILDHIREFEGKLTTPAYVYKDRYKYKRAREKLKRKNGKEPSLEEIAKEAKIHIRRIKLVVKTTKHPPVFLYIDQSSEEEGPPLGKDIVDNQRKFKKAEELLLTKEIISILPKYLTPKEAEVIKLTYGLNGNESHTQDEIGEIMNAKGKRVGQIYKEAIKKLQQALNN